MAFWQPSKESFPASAPHSSRLGSGLAESVTVWPMARRLLPLLAVLVVAVVVVVGLVQASGGDDDGAPAKSDSSFDLDRARERLRGAPAPLAALHAKANQVLDASPSSFEDVLAGLKGHPVVVNKWASWCGPCRFEFPLFQSQAVKRGRDVAFVGLNSGDNRAAAESFLRGLPIPFPSYEDPDEKIAQAIDAPKNYPITVFYDARGEQQYAHQGGYRSEADLAGDIERYAMR